MDNKIPYFVAGALLLIALAGGITFAMKEDVPKKEIEATPKITDDTHAPALSDTPETAPYADPPPNTQPTPGSRRIETAQAPSH